MGWNKIKSGYGSKSCAFLSYPPFFHVLSLKYLFSLMIDFSSIDCGALLLGRSASLSLGDFPPWTGWSVKKKILTLVPRTVYSYFSQSSKFILLGVLQVQAPSCGFPSTSNRNKVEHRTSSRCQIPMDEQDVIQLFLHTRAPFSLLGGGVPR